MNETQDFFIPLIWEGDGTHPSPNYAIRRGSASGYGVTALPSAAFNGDVFDVGGGSAYARYLNIYNNLVNISSPMEIDVQLGSASGLFDITADILMTETIPADDYRAIFMLTYYYSDTYSCTVVRYAEEDFNLTTSGSSEQFIQSFTLDPSWDIVNLKAVVLVQNVNTTGTFTTSGYTFNKYPILQGAITEFTGLLPMFTTNITEGPAHLGVQFTDNSFPQTGIDGWEWDFDGDGVFDSTEEDPFHLYMEPGVFDVTLRIEVDGEFAEITVEDYITVTDSYSVSGNLSGVWVTDFSPYIISEDIIIAEGDELIINPGVELQFTTDVQFTVSGLLTADASSSRGDPIVFKSDSYWKGIRFYISQENNILSNCEISNASISAILIEGNSKVDVIGCKIFDNNSTSLAAAFEVVGSDDVLISQNIIANNSSSNNTGGIACTASSPEISNNVIVNNTGQWGAFYFQNNSNPNLRNNTIVNNLSTNTTPYLIFLLSSVPTITNSIIIDNGEIYFPQSTPEITYSCVTGGFAGEGNINEDPLFVAATNGDGADYNGLAADWSLLAGSLCIDAGNPDAMYNDIDGTRNDMGAYGGPNGNW